jgi:glycosyltransferase involved in cell wall biosynthesis
MGEHMLTLAAELRSQYDITLVCMSGEQGAQLLERGQEMGLDTWPLGQSDYPADMDGLSSVLARGDFDIFHCHAGIGWEGHVGVQAAHLARIQVVRTEHLPYLLTDVGQKIEYERIVRLADRIIAVSEEAGRSYVEAGVPSSKLRVVLNGIHAQKGTDKRKEVCAELSLPPGSKLVLTVGRMTEQKAYVHLLRAVPYIISEHPDVCFLWVGMGPLWDTLEAEVRDMGLEEQVRFLGQRDDVPDLMHSSDLFVLPSLFEGLPLCALEAMHAGLPVVGTRVCGISEIVRDRVTGLLVDVGDWVAMAGAVNECLDNASRSAEWGAAGRRWATQYFTARRMARETDGIYREVLAAKKAHTVVGEHMGEYIAGI